MLTLGLLRSTPAGLRAVAWLEYHCAYRGKAERAVGHIEVVVLQAIHRAATSSGFIPATGPSAEDSVLGVAAFLGERLAMLPALTAYAPPGASRTFQRAAPNSAPPHSLTTPAATR